MKTNLNIFLILSLLAIFCIITISNIISYSYAEFFSNVINLGATSSLLGLCIINNFRVGIHGVHGASWILFTSSIATWFIAERMWELNMLTHADLFWFSGYVFYFIFGMVYLKPFAHQISKQIIVISSLVVVPIFIAVFFTIEWQSISHTDMIIASYPLVDAIMLIPSIIGLTLFFKGRVRFSWTLLLIGMTMFVMADYGFMYFDSIEEYYPGHIVDVPYIWAYVIFIGGILANINLFQKRDKNKRFNDQNLMK